MPETIRLAIRGFGGMLRQCVFEDRLEVREEEIESLLPALAKKHGERLASHELYMIEFEFLDEPNPNERFFRFGTDPGGMVAPIAIDLRSKDGR